MALHFIEFPAHCHHFEEKSSGVPILLHRLIILIKEGNVTKYILPSSVLYMILGKFLVLDSYLIFYEGHLLDDSILFVFFCLLVELFGVFLLHKKKVV